MMTIDDCSANMVTIFFMTKLSFFMYHGSISVMWVWGLIGVGCGFLQFRIDKHKCERVGLGIFVGIIDGRARLGKESFFFLIFGELTAQYKGKRNYTFLNTLNE